jgi:hypothetical protein
LDFGRGRDLSDTPKQHKASLTIESLTFADGSKIEVGAEDIIVFVGPNNAGKSATLREIDGHIAGNMAHIIIKNSVTRKQGSAADLREFLKESTKITGSSSQTQYRGMRFSVQEDSIDQLWNRMPGHFRPLFAHFLSTQSRLEDSNAQAAIPVHEAAPQHPIQMMYVQHGVEEKVSGYFKRAFGKDLIVFHGGGATWPLLVGDRPLPRDGEDRVSPSYIHRLLSLTRPLMDQGDGMRSFASILLYTLAPATLSVILIDEPEAFLHPPQARLVGEFIARERRPGTQLFVATHSADVLQGLLNASPDSLRIIRITRDGDANFIRELDKERAREISADPLMRFSSVLSGVFHQRVIVCESDADCMFYSSILDLEIVHGAQQPDVLFVHASGKHRMAAIASALRSLGVTVDVIADLDVLNDQSTMERLVLALSGEWVTVRADWHALKSSIEDRRPGLSAREVKAEILKALADISDGAEFPPRTRSMIEGLFKRASQWDAVKDAGAAAIPPGDATKHWQSLIRKCSDFGLWIVPAGELEGFCKSVGGHGPKWTQDVLETKVLATDAELAPARDFVRSIWARKPPTS